MNDTLVYTLSGNMHLLVIWCIGLGWALSYWRRHPRVSLSAGIALSLLIVSQFVIHPYLTWLLVQKKHALASVVVWISPIIEGIAWVIIVGTLFNRREQPAGAMPRPSECTVKCAQCGHRNARSAQVCFACGARLSETDAQADLVDWVRHYFDWNHDLGISEPRRRGVYRALGGASLVVVAGLTWIASGSVPVSIPVAMIGVASLPCAAAEMMTNRSWNQLDPILRIGLLSITPFVFAATVWLAALVRMRIV